MRCLVGRPVCWAVLILVLTLPAFIDHLVLATDAHRFNGDVAQHIAPYVMENETELADEDLISSYYRASHPVGFRLLYDGFSSIGDPRALSKVLPYFLLVGVIAACGWGAYALSGSVGVLVVLAVALSSEVFLSRMIGGCPRAFAFPIVALGLGAMVRGKSMVLGLSVLLAAAFYPVVGVGLGTMLAALQLLPSRWVPREKATPFANRLMMVAVVGVLAVLLVLPSQLAMRQYGPVSVGGEVEQSRLQQADRFDFSQPLPSYFVASLGEVVAGSGKGYIRKPHRWIMRKDETGRRARLRAIVATLAILCGIGCVAAAVRDGGTRRLLVAFVCVGVVYLLSVVASPQLFLPERHIAYGLPLIALLVFIAGGGMAMQIATSRGEAGLRLSGSDTPMFAGILCGIVLLFTAAPLRPDIGLKFHIADADVAWLHYLADTAPASMIAGDPELMDPVSYVTGRRVLTNWETNLPYHSAYLGEIERRKALVDRAIHDLDADAWKTLASEYGVTHLVLSELPDDIPQPQASVRVFREISIVTLSLSAG